MRWFLLIECGEVEKTVVFDTTLSLYFDIPWFHSLHIPSKEPSSLANGSYSSPGSVALQKGSVKGKVGRPDSRDVVFSPAAGQGGPPPQLPMHMQNSPVGTALPGSVRMEVPSSSSTLGS
ncbi:unnamed protein product, partial [Wuchereria bancrofti]